MKSILDDVQSALQFLPLRREQRGHGLGAGPLRREFLLEREDEDPRRAAHGEDAEREHVDGAVRVLVRLVVQVHPLRCRQADDLGNEGEDDDEGARDVERRQRGNEDEGRRDETEDGDEQHGEGGDVLDEVDDDDENRQHQDRERVDEGVEERLGETFLGRALLAGALAHFGDALQDSVVDVGFSFLNGQQAESAVDASGGVEHVENRKNVKGDEDGEGKFHAENFLEISVFHAKHGVDSVFGNLGRMRR